MFKKLGYAVSFAVAASTTFAQEGFEVPVTAEILSGWVAPDGSRTAALRLTLAPGWKTYWRAPGDAGIPPQFRWSDSRNLEGVAISWPTPKVFDQNGMRSIGYENSVTIPLHVEPQRKGKPVRLKATMELGICSDVCIPHELHLDALIDSIETKPTPAIAAALAEQPYSASEAGVTAMKCSVRPTHDGLEIETRITMPSAGSPEYVVIEPQAGDIWVSEAETQRQGNQIVATSEMVSVSGAPIALDRSAIRVTVLGQKHAVDIHGC